MGNKESGATKTLKRQPTEGGFENVPDMEQDPISMMPQIQPIHASVTAKPSYAAAQALKQD